MAFQPSARPPTWRNYTRGIAVERQHRLSEPARPSVPKAKDDVRVSPRRDHPRHDNASGPTASALGSAGRDLLGFAQGRHFATILADPPWQFTNKTGKVAPEHKRLSRYGTMRLDEIM